MERRTRVWHLWKRLEVVDGEAEQLVVEGG
jgi:hypothetical protein